MSLKTRELFCFAIQDWFGFLFNFQVLGANPVPRYGRYYGVPRVTCSPSSISAVTRNNPYWLKSTVLQRAIGGTETELLQAMSTKLRQASYAHEQD